MYTKLLDKQTKLALIGLGYVGLPIAMEFAKHVSVIGFDINEDRLDKLRNCIDPCGELPTEVFEHKDITFTSSIEKCPRRKIAEIYMMENYVLFCL